MQRCCVLAAIFGVAIHSLQSFVPLVDSFLKIDRGEDRGNRRKKIRILVGQTQRALTPHADAQQGNPRRHGLPPLGNCRHHMLEQIFLDRDLRVKLLSDAVRPPRDSRHGGNRPQSILLELLRDSRMVGEILDVAAVHVEHHIAVRRWGCGLENAAKMPRDFDFRPLFGVSRHKIRSNSFLPHPSLQYQPHPLLLTMSDQLCLVHVIGSLGVFDDAQNLRELAACQAAAGHHVVVIAFEARAEGRELAESVGLKCRVIRKRWRYDPFAARQLVQELRELQPDVVQLWGKRATNAAIIVRHALPEAVLIAKLGEVPQLRNPWWPNKSLDVLDAIVVEREDLRQEFVDAGQGEAKVHCIRPGVTTNVPQISDRSKFLTALGLPHTARIISMAGSLERWQLFDEAIWCFELIRILHEPTCMIVVGDGPERGRLERFTRQVTDPKVVRFMTVADRLDDVLAHTDVYWQPGLSRIIPTTLLQAMSHGLPVVASDTPIHRKVLNDKNGRLVPAAKRALWARHTDELIRNRDLASKLGRAARDTADRNFSFSLQTTAYDQLLHTLVADKAALCSTHS